MIAIFRKEINLFFSSLIGYVSVGVFLVLMGLFVWVLPNFNIIDGGYASLDTLFEVAPFVFMFLIPAITMRSFADERKTGTIEILSTKPITETQIVLGKYFAGMVLVVFSLLPMLLYYFSVKALASPVGNVDAGAFWGSYMGLYLLAAVYLALGIFCSTLTDNQIVAFILGMVLCATFYFILDQLTELSAFTSISGLLTAINIRSHYLAISRGVLDSRDLIYFFSIITLFLTLTKQLLVSRKW
ncbi:MAG: gliding motility-associated ABC transporter permease subunit GldF [Bacteroidota bacterium]|nr:gliding motility-associated ABC transporter permease subunit GldF [Bacteroidota bacterium]